MPKTELILTTSIVGLGAESDQVTVAAGYARNFLLPQGLAIPVTAANRRRLDALKQKRAERETHELNTMTELARHLSKLTLAIPVKTGEDGKMFGAVTAGNIADELKRQFDVALDKKKIHLAGPIRALGEHDVELRLHTDVTSHLKLRVESTTPLKTTERESSTPPTRGGSQTAARGGAAPAGRGSAPAKGGEPAERPANAGEKGSTAPRGRPRVTEAPAPSSRKPSPAAESPDRKRDKGGPKKSR